MKLPSLEKFGMFVLMMLAGSFVISTIAKRVPAVDNILRGA